MQLHIFIDTCNILLKCNQICEKKQKKEFEMACVTVPDWYNFLISHICCFCSTTCPYNTYTASAACHLTDSTSEKASTERTKQEAPELYLYTSLTRHCSQVQVSLLPRQPLKGGEGKVHLGWTSGGISLCKGLLN